MGRNNTATISLTAHQQEYIQKKLATGGYESVSEIVREALRVLEQKEDETFWEENRAKVALARKEMAAGKGIGGEQARKDMDEYMDAKDGKRSRRTRL